MASKSNDEQVVQHLEAALEFGEEELSMNTAALSLGIRAQKHFLSKLSSKTVAKLFINETGGRILDNLHRLAHKYSDKKDADKLRKSIIKSIAKMGIIYKNDLFSDHERELIEQFRIRFNSLAKSLITMYEADYKFDRLLLIQMCTECQNLIHQIISTHLTQKTHARIDYTFNYLLDLQFLEYSFDPDSTTNRAIIKEIVDDIQSAINTGLFNQT